MAMTQNYGIFYADTQVCIGTYLGTTPNYSDWQSDRPVIHAIVPPYVDPTNCRLLSILGTWYAATRVEAAISDAIIFGQHMLIKFAAENVLLGITQAGMTDTVRTVMAGVIQSLQTGSLLNAITLARAVPSGSKDATFITDARLLAAINDIEAYLGMARSTSL